MRETFYTSAEELKPIVDMEKRVFICRYTGRELKRAYLIGRELGAYIDPIIAATHLLNMDHYGRMEGRLVRELLERIYTDLQEYPPNIRELYLEEYTHTPRFLTALEGHLKDEHSRMYDAHLMSFDDFAGPEPPKKRKSQPTTTKDGGSPAKKKKRSPPSLSNNSNPVGSKPGFITELPESLEKATAVHDMVLGEARELPTHYNRICVNQQKNGGLYVTLWSETGDGQSKPNVRHNSVLSSNPCVTGDCVVFSTKNILGKENKNGSKHANITTKQDE